MTPFLCCGHGITKRGKLLRNQKTKINTVRSAPAQKIALVGEDLSMAEDVEKKVGDDDELHKGR